ncbi:ComF family protein [Alkalihalobacillus sp. LMS39]|uniref:ComF family protein n=1 Tax=Alkalihalobacillus sp. LMS39 TaxID=2924032 RepID=UPI001FB2CEAC|nr:ComF family protein [Alkalihalobacillus sp. LMS39]UOE93812.1 ComF family protein [Alkalihalobacillus sp. LMS39]
MSYCLYCDTPFMEQVSWSTFCGVGEEEQLCSACRSKLNKISGEICTVCGRMLLTLDERYYNNHICNDCTRWNENKMWNGVFQKNRSLYEYNEFLKEVIARFKYRGDVVLATLFHQEIQKMYDKHFPAHIVTYIPLSQERLWERGFNQAEEVARVLPKCHSLLVRLIDEEKQSKKSRNERLAKTTPFTIKKGVETFIRNADIIIVDDIYTTGSTVRQAGKVLKQVGANSISSLTIARG